MSTGNRRAQSDVKKLIASHHDVELADDDLLSFTVVFHGPKDTPYEGGIWKVRVELPPDYPFKSPSIGFDNHIFHPNIDYKSGSVCLDVLNQTWSPMFGLINIFDSFLPQLLSYPNAEDPMNHNAALLWRRSAEMHSEEYNDYVRKEVAANIAASSRTKDSESPATQTPVEEEDAAMNSMDDDEEMSSLDELSDDY